MDSQNTLSASIEPVANSDLKTNQVITKPKKRVKAKLFIFGCIFFLCFGVVGFAALTVYAFTSNQNIPLISDLVENIEKLAVTDRQIGQMVSDELVRQVDLINQSSEPLNFKPISTSYEYDFNSNTKITSNGQSYDIVLNGDGVSNQDLANMQQSVNLKSQINFQGANFTPNLNYRSFGLGGSQVIYFNLNNLPVSLVPNLKPVDNKWIKVDYKEIYESLGVDLQNVTSNVTNRISSEDINKLKQIVKDEEFINSFKRMPDEVINGVRTYCVAMNFSDASLKRYVNNIKNIVGDSTQLDLSNLQVSEFVFTTCIGRVDKLPYKVSFDVSATSKSESIKIAFDMNFKNYGKSISLEEPAADLSLQDAIVDLYSFSAYNQEDYSTLDDSSDLEDYYYDSLINGNLDLNTLL